MEDHTDKYIYYRQSVIPKPDILEDVRLRVEERAIFFARGIKNKDQNIELKRSNKPISFKC